MLLATLLCYVGFTALCLSMSKHYGELLQGKLSANRSRLLKVFGWSCLGLSLWAALGATAWGMGLVQWFAALMACALLLVFLIPFRPRLALILAVAGLLFSPVAAFNQLLI
jgi:hypothetical protein